MKLTCATWNTHGGGIDSGDDARFRRQMAILAALGPSVVALQECKRWDEDDYATFYTAERLLGMRGLLAPSAHHGCHLAVFIRESAGLRVIGQRNEHGNEWWHGIACMVVEAEAFPRPLQLASCHLAPSSPERRLAEAEAFALVAKRGTLIAAGDWNAVPASDPEPSRPVTGAHRRKLDRRAAQALEELGLTDVGSHTGDATPTVGHASELPYRCDRLYTSLPAEAITGYRVITTADDESDHRLVIAEFDLALAAGTATGGACPVPRRAAAPPPAPRWPDADGDSGPGQHWSQHSNDIGDYCPHSGQPVPAEYEAGADDPRCPAGCRASRAEDDEEIEPGAR
jgi:endonuclease/exonuclease/phosphatase family metal-dependent hydrolase